MSSPFRDDHYDPPPAPQAGPAPYELEFTARDDEQLRLLAIFYFVFAALGVICTCGGLAWFAMVGTMISTMPTPQGQPGPPPGFIAAMMAVYGGCFIVIALATTVLQTLAGFSLLRQRRYLLCIIVAALNCTQMPFGTVLGVLTLIVLSRPGVKARFQQVAQGSA